MTAPAPPSRLRWAAALAAALTAAFALANLATNLRHGHQPHGGAQWQWLPTVTALALAALAAALGLALSAGVNSRRARAAGAAALLWTLAVLTQRLVTTPGAWEARLSPTMLLMALLAAAMAGGRKHRGWPPTLAMLSLLLATTAVMEVLLAGPWQLLGPAARPANPAAAFGIVLLSAGWLCAAPERRPAAFLLERSSAGWLTRRLLPLLVVFPFLLAWVHREQQEAHALGSEAGLLLIVLIAFVAFLTLVWKAASALDRVDMSRADLQAYAREVSDLYDRAPCGYFSLDAQARVVRINDTALSWFGYGRREVEGRMGFTDLLAPHSRDAFLDALRAMQAPGRTWEMELELLRQNGSTFSAVVTSTAITDEQGRFLRTRSTLWDTTQRRLAEAALRSSEERLRLLLDSTGEGIYATDLEGRCTLCNPAAVRMLGYDSPGQLLGRLIDDLARRGPATAPAEDAREHDAETFWRADGTSFPVEYRCYPILRNGEMVGQVVSFTDITERRSLEHQIRQSQKMEAIGRLAAGVAHDFNNLLTVINGYADMLYESGLPLAARDKLASIRKAGDRAARLTHQLLAFSRQQMLEPRVLDLNLVVCEIEGLLRRTIGEDIELRTELGLELWPVKADATQLDQVLMNLVVNARDAMANGGTLTLATRNRELDAAQAQALGGLPAGDYVELAVHDTGSGMRPQTQAHIFEPFFTTKPPGQGTGLGLPTVFGIARQSGGGVAVESEWGRGTVVRFYLPAHVAAAAAADDDRERGREQAAGGGETIMVVEDDDELRDMLAGMLRHRGYTVLDAAGPNEALAMSGRHAGVIHLLLADVVLPAMNGRALASRLRSERPGLRVLMTSGYASQAGGPAPFLGKPFAPETLVRTVRGILDEGAADAAEGGR